MPDLMASNLYSALKLLAWNRNQHSFYRFYRSDSVWTMQKLFKNRKRKVCTHFTCWRMFGWTQISCLWTEHRVGCDSTRLTPQTMSEPFIINCTGQNSESDGIHPMYVLNNVRMDPNIIFVDRTPSRLVFYQIDTPDNARTIHYKFYWSEFRIGWYPPDLHFE
jgi:hypothetical protein